MVPPPAPLACSPTALLSMPASKRRVLSLTSASPVDETADVVVGVALDGDEARPLDLKTVVRSRRRRSSEFRETGGVATPLVLALPARAPVAIGEGTWPEASAVAKNGMVAGCLSGGRVRYAR